MRNGSNVKNTTLNEYLNDPNFLKHIAEDNSDGRADVRKGTGKDELLKRLIEVHGQPRFNVDCT